MGICVGIILMVLIANIIRKVNMEDNPVKQEEVIQESTMSKAEAYRLLSYLEFNRSDRESMSLEIHYQDDKMSGWYDKYVNVLWKMGLIDNYITTDPKGPLTYGECKMLVDRYILTKPNIQGVYQNLTFDFMRSEEPMAILHFVELYDVIRKQLPKGERIKEETLFVLDRSVSEDGKDRMATQIGKYYYEDVKNYQTVFQYKKQLNEGVKKEELSLPYIQKVSSSEINTELKYKVVHGLVCDNEIIYIIDVTTERIVLPNIWIQEGKDLLVKVFMNGMDIELPAKSRLSTNIERVVGDIAIENSQVVGISVKPDMIQGKVLQANKEYIEVEGYGKLPLEENYRIYKVYGDLSMEETNSILVGYESTDFVVSGGKISAALIRNAIKAENIRVLLNTSGYKGIHHSTVKLTSDQDFTVKTLESEKTYGAGETLTLEPGDALLSEGRVTITPSTENGKIQILSIERMSGNPKYRGIIEVSEESKGLLIVNDLPMEEYLYSVIPSEMPTYYGLEPLKVQAVCARSYAYRHLMANSLSNYGAHVDDSVTYQVYNNIEENEDSILAVKDTYGKVVTYEDEVITAYYFSTSCGHTTGVESVWANGVPTPYLTGRLMYIEDSLATTASTETKRMYENLAKEDNFRTFIMDHEFPTYDKQFQWYRWNVEIPVKEIKKNIDQKLSNRYDVNPDLILTLVRGSEKDGNAEYESHPLTTVGDIVDIFVRKRETGGIISELVIVGTERTILVKTEYNVRALLAPGDSKVNRNDGSSVNQLSLLPSAFFVIDTTKDGSSLSSINLHGGGYGHGVGMSQNGVKSLADAGKDYDDIVTYFYQGTSLGFIY